METQTIKIYKDRKFYIYELKEVVDVAGSFNRFCIVSKKGMEVEYLGFKRVGKTFIQTSYKHLYLVTIDKLDKLEYDKEEYDIRQTKLDAETIVNLAVSHFGYEGRRSVKDTTILRAIVLFFGRYTSVPYYKVADLLKKDHTNIINYSQSMYILDGRYSDPIAKQTKEKVQEIYKLVVNNLFF